MKILLALLLAGLLGLIGTSSAQAQDHHRHSNRAVNAHGYNYGHSGVHQRSYGGYSQNLYAPSYGATYGHPSRPQYAQPYQSYYSQPYQSNYSQPYQSYYAPGQVYQPRPSHYDYHAPTVQQHGFFHRDVTPGYYDLH